MFAEENSLFMGLFYGFICSFDRDVIAYYDITKMR